MKCAIFEEHSSSCVVYFRFSGTLFPVSMIDGAVVIRLPAVRISIQLLSIKHLCFECVKEAIARRGFFNAPKTYDIRFGGL